jgi:small-conductance mechanosensitive channel
MPDWLSENWVFIAVPVLVYLACYVVGLWVRRIAYRAFNRWAAAGKWEGSPLIVQATRTPFLVWFLIFGAYVAIHVSVLDPLTKALADKVLVALLIISVTWMAISLAEKLLRLYIGKVERLRPSETLIVNIARITIAVVGALILLDAWGAPTTPIILLLAAAVLVAVFVFRDLLANLFSGFQLAQGEQIKVGDFVRLESGESGSVVDVTWRNTRIRSLDGNVILVPNSRLLQGTVINYGHPLKKATQPFRFYTRLHLKELTGLKASNLTELLDRLKKVPGSVIYYHTHNFLEEHQYLIPEPANDFALWVSDELGDEVLGEKLASIDTFGFPTIAALRARIIGVIEEHLSENPDGRTALKGREFHFIRSISVILPTPYVAHDLREFIEVLRKVSIDSLSFHIFEARLRLQKGVNDFSIWMEDCLGDKDLADKIAYLDPYNYTLEGLRSTIIQLVEKRIK